MGALVAGLCSGCVPPGTENVEMSSDTAFLSDNAPILEATEPLEASETAPEAEDVLSVEIVPVIDTIEFGTPHVVTAYVDDPAYQLSATWISSLDGPLVTVTPDASGMVTFDTSSLSSGWHDMTLDVANPAADRASETVPIAICECSDPETLSADITGAGWQIYGDAYWDPGGWLEMTDRKTFREGPIFYIEKKVPAGDLNIDFKIWTGGGTNSGADGFAVSITNVADLSGLTPIIQAANAGGCPGYGVAGSGVCDSNMVVDAFHIEFDTWHNGYPQNDPTTDNHVAITLDGEPGVHYLWGAIPSIDDSEWHDVSVQVQGDAVLVTNDGLQAIKGDIPGLDFEGGFLGFSGTTGFATNYHRFDDLQIRDECLVPKAQTAP